MKEYKDKNILTSVNHTLKVLDLLCVRTNLGVSEISRITGYDKASVYKMLYTLQHRGYVIKDENAKYNISEKLATGSKPAERHNVSDIAVPYLQRLRDLTKETIFLGVLNTNGKVVLLNIENGLCNDSLKSRLAYELDAYSTALGKLLLANLDEAFLDNVLNIIQLYPLTENTITDKEELKKQLLSYKNNQYVIQHDENYMGHSDIASAIYDENNRIVAGLSIGCTTEKLKTNKDEFIKHLLETSQTISSMMGYQK